MAVGSASLVPAALNEIVGVTSGPPCSSYSPIIARAPEPRSVGNAVEFIEASAALIIILLNLSFCTALRALSSVGYFIELMGATPLSGSSKLLYTRSAKSPSALCVFTSEPSR